MGLLGLAARQAGSRADKGKAKLTTRVSSLIMLLSCIAIALGAHSLAALIVGILLLDLAVQAVYLITQSVIYAQMTDARNRLNAGYVTSCFIGGATGSLLSATAYHLSGWYGVCSAGALLTLINLLIWFNGQRFEQEKMS